MLSQQKKNLYRKKSINSVSLNEIALRHTNAYVLIELATISFSILNAWIVNPLPPLLPMTKTISCRFDPHVDFILA